MSHVPFQKRSERDDYLLSPDNENSRNDLVDLSGVQIQARCIPLPPTSISRFTGRDGSPGSGSQRTTREVFNRMYAQYFGGDYNLTHPISREMVTECAEICRSYLYVEQGIEPGKYTWRQLRGSHNPSLMELRRMLEKTFKELSLAKGYWAANHFIKSVLRRDKRRSMGHFPREIDPPPEERSRDASGTANGNGESETGNINRREGFHASEVQMESERPVVTVGESVRRMQAQNVANLSNVSPSRVNINQPRITRGRSSRTSLQMCTGLRQYPRRSSILKPTTRAASASSAGRRTQVRSAHDLVERQRRSRQGSQI